MTFSVVLHDNYPSRDKLLPLVATRPIGNLRIGILTLNQKWELLFDKSVSYFTVDYLSTKFPLSFENESEILFIESTTLPDFDIFKAIVTLSINQCLVDQHGRWVAARVSSVDRFDYNDYSNYDAVVYDKEFKRLIYPEDIFTHNASQISFDLALLKCEKIDSLRFGGNTLIGEDIFIHESVSLYGVVLDSSKGPIYIGEKTIVEPGVVINGPVAIGANCRLKTGALLYPNVTLGDLSTICGELNNVVIWGNSTKGHHGYLGCAVVGEGCNLGAGTSNSNLKNDWSTVKLYDYETKSFRDTNLSKCGVIIGDQVMLGIKSMITTGTVIGVGAQVAMSKFIPKFVPDFSWFTDDKMDTYLFYRFSLMMSRKSILKKEELTNDDMEIYLHLSQITEELRNF